MCCHYFLPNGTPCLATLHECQNSVPIGELEETTGTPPYYVDEDYPAGPGIIEPLPQQSN